MRLLAAAVSILKLVLCPSLFRFLRFVTGINCFGPTAKAAQLESSKEFAKSFMDKHGIPTAQWASFKESSKAKKHILTADYKALVVKASGLAEGKGVVVAQNAAEAVAAVEDMLDQQRFSAASETIVVEELLDGFEVSVLGFCDGARVCCLPAAQDHKRLQEGNKGPNTGGMGAYAPCPMVRSFFYNFLFQIRYFFY